MSTTAKVIVTIVAIAVFIFSFAALVHSNKQGGSQTPGILGLVLFLGLVAAIRAIWASSNQANDNDRTLDKS